MPVVKDLSAPIAPIQAPNAPSTVIARPTPTVEQLFGGAVANLPERPQGIAQVPYVGSVSMKSQKYATEFQPAGLNDGDFYIAISGMLLKLAPLKFWLIDAQSCRTFMDSTGTILAASLDIKDATKPDANGVPRKLDEHYVCLLLVDVNGVVTPAKADFRGTKWTTGGNMVEAVKAASDPLWQKLSGQHLAASAAPTPGLRVTGFATPQRKVSRTTGNPYYIAPPRAMPTAPDDLIKLSNAMATPTFLSAVQDVAESCSKRMQEIARVAAGK